jgi:hypothetical protein
MTPGAAYHSTALQHRGRPRVISRRPGRSTDAFTRSWRRRPSQRSRDHLPRTHYRFSPSSVHEAERPGPAPACLGRFRWQQSSPSWHESWPAVCHLHHLQSRWWDRQRLHCIYDGPGPSAPCPLPAPLAIHVAADAPLCFRDAAALILTLGRQSPPSSPLDSTTNDGSGEPSTRRGKMTGGVFDPSSLYDAN